MVRGDYFRQDSGIGAGREAFVDFDRLMDSFRSVSKLG